jgi:aspartate aminotransferase-like enzyme
MIFRIPLTVGKVVVDAVCSVASEEVRMDDWGIDVVLSASQKGLGIPPGLSVVCASQRAIKVSHRSCHILPLTILGVRNSLYSNHLLLCKLEKVSLLRYHSQHTIELS